MESTRLLEGKSLQDIFDELSLVQVFDCKKMNMRYVYIVRRWLEENENKFGLSL